jgi:hypothetical protein
VELPRSEKSLSELITLDFPRKGSIAVHVDGLLLVAARPAPSAGLVVV